ncbi:hypothetical protein BFG52_02290 [Acinetobacter larvae]|uniref:Uncharacterized protein n=2 Tax=Acinetobacter larvae TaxID=1789224 RepID=A0A1B2LWH2_9GAMM|nr:hypothetical protein BFG52_02290 [Acinetobacter larvae]
MVIVMCMAAMNSFAQQKTIKFDDAMCDVEGKFDTNKFKTDEVLNTMRFIRDSGAIILPPTNWEKLNLAKVSQMMKQEYEQEKRALQQKKLVNLPEVQQLRTMYLGDLDLSYDINLRIVHSTQDPTRLLTTQYGDKCLAIAKQLNQSDAKKIIQSWHDAEKAKIARYLKEGEQYSANLFENNFKREYTSQNPLFYAKKNLTDAWNNCAVDYLPSNIASRSDKVDALNTAIETKIFNGSLKYECD